MGSKNQPPRTEEELDSSTRRSTKPWRRRRVARSRREGIPHPPRPLHPPPKRLFPKAKRRGFGFVARTSVERRLFSAALVCRGGIKGMNLATTEVSRTRGWGSPIRRCRHAFAGNRYRFVSLNWGIWRSSHLHESLLSVMIYCLPTRRHAMNKPSDNQSNAKPPGGDCPPIGRVVAGWATLTRGVCALVGGVIESCRPGSARPTVETAHGIRFETIVDLMQQTYVGFERMASGSLGLRVRIGVGCGGASGEKRVVR